MADQKPLRVGSDGATITQFQSGDTISVAAGGTGATTAAGARTALGLTIGTDIQAYDADLTAIAAISTNGALHRTGTNTWTIRSLATASSARITVANGDGVSGNPTVDLATVSNGGGGTFYKFTVDSYGRVSGYSAVGTGDITALVGGTYAPINNPTFTGTVTLPGAPGSALQAATKQYVDDLFSSGGIAPFSAVKAATTANITLSGAQTIDGVSVVASDRVLVKNQTTTSQNGVYVVAAGTWARASDADQSSEFVPARQVFAAQGSTQANTGWAVSSAANPTINTDPITFTQVSGATQYTNGNGLSLTGNVFAAVGVSGRITVGGSGIDLASGIVSPGTYTKVTVDTYGRITTGATATPGDIGAQPVDATLTALAAYNTNGILTQTAADTFVGRSIATANSARITVSNGDGVSGNPTLDLATTGVGAGTYNSVTVDTYGRVTAGTVTPLEYNATAATNGEATAIAIGRAVYVSAAGAVRLANANAAGTKDVVGLVASTSVASSASGSIAVAGALTATTGQWDAVTGQTGGLTFNARYYLSNTTAGALTTTPPASGYVVQVGIAMSTTKMALNIGPVIQL